MMVIQIILRVPDRHQILPLLYKTWDETFTRKVIKASFKKVGIVFKNAEATAKAQAQIMDTRRKKQVSLGILHATKKRKLKIATHEKNQRDAKKRIVCTMQENEDSNKALTESVDVNICMRACECCAIILTFPRIRNLYIMHSENSRQGTQI